ncbi:hypothetical protein KSU16_16255 [Escherichia coli]|uniref:hypothetical protein n=1 Tax=Escherichia coli TaxID=562 RepID=UPI0021CE2399|nr:hypothetical protein [Escherichia coli]MCU6343559.1 hypothetical protein [Escherichia coli]
MSPDANYTQTCFDIINDHISVLTLTPRVCYYITTLATFYIPPCRLSVWVVTMYPDVQQDFSGGLNRLSMSPPALQRWLQRVNRNGERYDVTRPLSLTAEVGVEKRESIFVVGEFRLVLIY